MEDVIPMRLFSVPFSYADVKKSVCLLPDEVSRSSAKDCVVNTLYFLKMFKKEDAEMYARVIHDDKMNGLTMPQVFDLIFRRFTQISKTQDAIIYIKKNTLKELEKNIKPNKCTYVSFPHIANPLARHAVVVFKDDKGKMGVYDAQTYNFIYTDEEWAKWNKIFDEKDLEVLYETNKRIRKSGRKDEKQPLKRVRKVSPQKSKSKSKTAKSLVAPEKSKSKSKSISVKSHADTPLAEPPPVVKEPSVVKELPVVLEEAKKNNAKSRKIRRVIKKEIKQTGLEKNHQLRISQKIKNDKIKRDNLFKINRRPQMDVVTE